MNITLYTCTAEPNRLDKTGHLSQNATYSATIDRTLTMSIQKPVIVIQDALATIAGVNYCYISEFERYYYVRKIDTAPNGIYTMYTEVDVLMSFKSVILLQRGIVKKNANLYNMYLPGDVKTEVRPVVSTVQFTAQAGSGYFTNQNEQYILLGIGGK